MFHWRKPLLDSFPSTTHDYVISLFVLFLLFSCFLFCFFLYYHTIILYNTVVACVKCTRTLKSNNISDYDIRTDINFYNLQRDEVLTRDKERRKIANRYIWNVTIKRNLNEKKTTEIFMFKISIFESIFSSTSKILKICENNYKNWRNF